MKLTIKSATLPCFADIGDLEPGDVFFPGIGAVACMRTGEHRQGLSGIEWAAVSLASGSLSWYKPDERVEVAISSEVIVERVKGSR